MNNLQQYQKSIYKIGPIFICIRGYNSIIKYVKEELEGIKSDTFTETDVDFEFRSKPVKIRNFVESTGLRFNSQLIDYKKGGIHCQIIFNKIPLKVYISTIRNKLLTKFSNFFFRFVTKDFLNLDEMTAKNFTYNFFDLVTELQLLKNGASYVHASVVEKEGKAVAFIGGGGIGKSSIMLSLCLEKGWKYLSDDLGIFVEDGTTFRSPKKIQIYKYNTIKKPKLEKNLLRKHSFINRMFWYIHNLLKGSKGVRRRVHPEEIFSEDSISSFAKLDKVIFLEKSDVENFHTSNISAQKLAICASNILLEELSPLPKIINLSNGSLSKSPLLNINEFLDQISFILAKSWESCHLRHVTIPINASQNDIIDYLERFELNKI